MFPHEYINAQCKNRSQGNDDEQIPDTTPSKLPSKVIQIHPLWGARSLTSHAWRFIFHRALQEPRFLNGKIIFFYFNAFIFRKGNCFTTRCWFLPYINMSQPQVQMCPLPAESPSPLPPHPTPLGCYRAPI